MAQNENVYRPYLDRRSPDDLPPLQTSFAASPMPKGRRSRPVQPLVGSSARQPHLPLVTPAPQLKPERRQSKMSLFNLFSKPKVERLRGYTENGMPEVTASSRQTQTPTTYAVSPAVNIQAPPKAISTLIGPPRVVQQIPPRESSRRESQPNLSRQPNPLVWEPPPLFEAYPQSIKHAFLPALNYSADSILRAQKSKRNSLLNSFRDSKIDLTLEDSERAYSKVATDRTSKRFSSQSFTGSGWTRKIFVLIASGVLLQYTSDGCPERQPEKFLQLEKDSAAFASDAIPGRHWVLQVSQSTNDGNGAPPKSRSLLSRFKIQNSATRKLTSNMLLVMESPEDMNSWMMAIRHEIEVMRGKQRESDAHVDTKADESSLEHDFHDHRNHHYAAHRHAAKISPTMSPIQDTPSSPEIVTSECESTDFEAVTKKSNIEIDQPNAVDGTNFKSPRHSIQRPPSDRASTTTYLSSGEHQLNQLRNGSRESNVSSNSLATSRASSPESQMSHPSKSVEQESRHSSMVSKPAFNSPPLSSNSWRRSMQTLPKTDEYLVFPKETPPRGKRVSMRSDASTSPAEPSSNVSSGSPPRFQRTSLAGFQSKAMVESTTARPQEDDVSPTDTSQSARSVQSSPNAKKFSATPDIPEVPAPEEEVSKPSLIRPLRSVNALNQESRRRTSDPRMPRRNSAVPMRLPIRPTLPALNTAPPAKPVARAPVLTFLATPSPVTPSSSVAAPAPAAVPKQTEPSSLKRPTNVQVRANHAPFLSTVRPSQPATSSTALSQQAPRFNLRSSSLFAPVTVNGTTKPYLAGARSYGDLGASRSSSSSSILAPPPRSTGSRYFSDSSARIPIQIPQNGNSAAGQRALTARASMSYLNRDSGIGLPPPSAPPEVPLPSVPTQIAS